MIDGITTKTSMNHYVMIQWSDHPPICKTVKGVWQICPIFPSFNEFLKIWLFYKKEFIIPWVNVN